MGTASSLLANHVTLRVRSVDRLWIAGYLPGLAYEGGLVSFLLQRRRAASGRATSRPRPCWRRTTTAWWPTWTA